MRVNEIDSESEKKNTNSPFDRYQSPSRQDIHRCGFPKSLGYTRNMLSHSPPKFGTKDVTSMDLGRTHNDAR
jgi:hypothetical protein